jgi:hypothetical protein
LNKQKKVLHAIKTLSLDNRLIGGNAICETTWSDQLEENQIA